MKVAFDTSVLVAALVEAHEHHERALVWMAAAHEGRITAVATWHAFAEVWSVLTRLPRPLTVAPATAERIVGRLPDVLRPLAVTGDAYRRALVRCGERGLRSGAIFDAIHLIAAELDGAEAMLTFNVGDFKRLSVEGLSPSILAPPDPPVVTMPP